MKYRGMALLTGLLLLAAVSVLAVTAAGSMTLQQHQAANHADRILASSGADLAGSWALAWLYGRHRSERQADCVSSCLLPPGIHGSLPAHPEFESLAWWQTNGVPAGRNPVSGETVGFALSGQKDALWVMEELHFEPVDDQKPAPGVSGTGYYRIFSRGSGRNPGNAVVTEAIVARPWGEGVEAAAFPPDRPMAEFCDRLEPSLPCGTLSWRRRR